MKYLLLEMSCFLMNFKMRNSCILSLVHFWVTLNAVFGRNAIYTQFQKKGTVESCISFGEECTVLVKSFAHLNGNFFLAFLEEIGKLWKGWPVYSGVLQLTHFFGMIICNGLLATLVAVEACLKIEIAVGKCM